jgi:hypothetical protein
MYGIDQHLQTVLEAEPDSEADSLNVVVGELFNDCLWDEAATGKMRRPSAKNGNLHLDPITTITLSELSWFFDHRRHEQFPLYGPDAVEKMRQPVTSFRHYRVGVATLRYLFDLAWS